MQGDVPPIRLRLLGEVDLRRGEEELTRVLAQPHRFALLVHMVLAVPGGFVRRDHLLGMFWPGSDEARARGSLRQALRYLRRGLGDGVLVGRGDAEVGIDGASFGCDVWDFHRYLERGEDTRALAQYEGALLPGFLVSGAPEFERWLTGERRRVRAEAVHAALRVATAAEEAGDLERAAQATLRAVQIDPVDEATARHRIGLLSRMGNRGAAVAAFEALATRLREELDLAPSPETEALVAGIRQGSDGEAPPRPFAQASEASRDPRRVLVTRFRNRTGRSDLDVLGGMAADWIAQEMAPLEELSVVPLVVPPEPAASEEDAPKPPPDDDRIQVLTAGTGAGTVVEGIYYLENDTLRFRARIIDAVEDRLIPGPDDVRASVDRPLDGLEELSRRINACLAPMLSSRAVHVRSGARPPSFEAYRAYMEGLEAFIRGRWEAALSRFRQAVEIEPEYALPRVVRAIAHWNLGQLEEAETVAREAEALRHRLGRFEGAVLDMVRAWLAGDWLGAYEADRVQAGIAPGSIPHFQVAEEARRLNRPGEALAVLSRLDPERGELDGWIFYWIELTMALHFLGDHAEELERARRARSLHPGSPVGILLEVRALAGLGRSDELARLLDDAEALPGDRQPRVGDLYREAGLELAAHGDPSQARPFLDHAADWYAERVDAQAGPALRRDLARTLYYANRWDEAAAIFQELAETDSATLAPVGFHHGHLQAHLDVGYLAVLAARRGDDEELERWRQLLVEAPGPFLYGAQWFWLACLDAVTGEEDRAAARLRRALAEGLPHEMFLHTDPHLRALEGHPRFDAIMAPRG